MQPTENISIWPHRTAHARWVEAWECRMTYLGKLLSSIHLFTFLCVHFLTESIVLLVCFWVFVVDNVTLSGVGWNLNIDT